ncbi:MAG: hypothetical protein IKS76_02865 [Paludibacteraceae bacterium]|nr:hypothetical protein [Paludibacteraceae bacterium]
MDRTAKIIGYLVLVHLLGLAAMTVCRLVLLFTNMPEDGIDWSLAGRALLIGVKFDNLIGCYIAALPCLVLPVLSIIMEGRMSYTRVIGPAVRTTTWWFGVLYSLVLFIEVANARYFHFFGNHLNIGVTEWFGFAADTTGMIFGDTMNRVFLGLAALLIVLYISSLRTIEKKIINP